MIGKERHGRPASTLRSFLASEAAGGALLVASAALALVIANSPLAGLYREALATPIGPLAVLHWINDGLMAVFFLLVSLEIKRELFDGHLRHWAARALPGCGALGGMAVPALIYAALNAGSPATLRGWAIPSATDIAFALGVLALLGDRVPGALKVFLTALAILDDLGAIVIIGVFYSHDLSLPFVGLAGLALVALYALNLFGVSRLWPYLAIGALLWLFVLRSGVHATIAGVVLAFAIPLRPANEGEETSPLHRLENALDPYVAFAVLPLFGFANAGVVLGGAEFSLASAPVLAGVAAGLFVGKQIGVFAAVALAVKTGLAHRPKHVSWAQLYGVAVLCGVGFTMSLFIGQVAFGDGDGAIAQTKLGVLVGSLLSIALGTLVLLSSSTQPEGGKA
ncbi:MAG: Na+/H+ antiporter NhaA [Methylocystis sp.]|nr:Na+/H+ antiporter NhaA [Methylocystis sp.]